MTKGLVGVSCGLYIEIFYNNNNNFVLATEKKELEHRTNLILYPIATYNVFGKIELADLVFIDLSVKFSWSIIF